MSPVSLFKTMANVITNFVVLMWSMVVLAGLLAMFVLSDHSFLLVAFRNVGFVACVCVLSHPFEPFLSVVLQPGDVHHNCTFVSCLKVWLHIFDSASHEFCVQAPPCYEKDA